jgi:uncharacterized protein with FMN-binding domain
MNKIALSLFVVATSGVYVWSQAGHQDVADPLAAMANNSVAGISPSPAGESTAGSDGPAVVADSATATDCLPLEPGANPVESPAAWVPPPEVTNAAMTTVSGLRLADGTYTGPTTDAYYGPMQIEVVVQNGKLVTLRALQYPSDRRTSLLINRQALPMLRDEAIAAQSADVDIITGATLTSEAFIRSLSGALAQAGR